MIGVKERGFTLVEILVGIVIVSFVIIAGFYALTNINVGKIKLIEETSIEKEAFYFSEKLFEFIKTGGMVDYEEYFNRSNVDTTSFTGGHYSTLTGFGNNSDHFYYCISGNGASMGTGGCITDFNTSGSDLTGTDLLYGQYAYQFIDYNSNFDADGGDQDGNLSPLGDDDDEYLGLGPDAFSSSGSVLELYLINADKIKRTFIRWNVSADPNKPSTSTCSGLGGDPKSITGSGCLGEIAFLKLEGVDWGNDHIRNSGDNTEYDGIIDTWLFDRDIYGLSSSIVADVGGNSEDYWLPLFSDNINVKKVDFFLYPSKDINLAWKDPNPAVNLAPYVRINLTLSPSRKKRATIKGNALEFNFSTTLSLRDIFIK